MLYHNKNNSFVGRSLAPLKLFTFCVKLLRNEEIFNSLILSFYKEGRGQAYLLLWQKYNVKPPPPVLNNFTYTQRIVL